MSPLDIGYMRYKLITRWFSDQKPQLGDIRKPRWRGCCGKGEGHAVRGGRIHVESLLHATSRSAECNCSLGSLRIFFSLTKFKIHIIQIIFDQNDCFITHRRIFIERNVARICRSDATWAMYRLVSGRLILEKGDRYLQIPIFLWADRYPR